MLLVGGVGYAAIAGWSTAAGQPEDADLLALLLLHLVGHPAVPADGRLRHQGRDEPGAVPRRAAWMGHWRGGLAVARWAAAPPSARSAARRWRRPRPCRRSPAGDAPARLFGRARTGTLAAGGTLGILIPPSVILVIYAIYTEQNIGMLFIAAVIPGLIATAGYMLVVTCTPASTRRPRRRPSGCPMPSASARPPRSGRCCWSSCWSSPASRRLVQRDRGRGGRRRRHLRRRRHPRRHALAGVEERLLSTAETTG